MISFRERVRLKDADKFEILALPINKYFKRIVSDIGSLYWQANDPIEKYHFQQNLILEQLKIFSCAMLNSLS